MKRINFQDLIIKETAEFIVINKPANISALEDRNSKLNVLALARSYLPNLQLCHRLDKETSGAMLLAKSPEVYKLMALQFQNREVSKIYHAVVNGRHGFEQEGIDLSLLHSGGKAKISRRGKPALTFVTTLDTFRNQTLVECRPITGRMHQIRAHLAAINAPIVSDSLYGGQPVFLSEFKRTYNIKQDTEEQPIISRVALHASKLEFANSAGVEIGVEAAYPKDFNVLLKQLKNYG